MNVSKYRMQLESQRDFSVRLYGVDYEVRFLDLSSEKPCLGFGSSGKEWVFLSLEKGWIENLSLLTYRDRTIQEILEKGERL